jgi:hypothetical protein
MNCRQCRKRVLDAFAAGETALPGGVVGHQQDCEACRAYCESQANLFRRLEEGVRAIANEGLPPSLAPGMRARLNQELPSASPWVPAWGTAAVAVTVLAVSLGSALLYRAKHHSVPSEQATAAPHGTENRVAATREPPEAAKPPSRREPKRARARASGRGAENSEVTPVVIVLPEERAAFARFVAELPREQQVALASPTNDESTEIVALEIEGLDVKSLDPGWE